MLDVWEPLCIKLKNERKNEMSNRIKNTHLYYTTYVVKNEKEYKKLLKRLEKVDEVIEAIYEQKDGSSKLITTLRGEGDGGWD